MRRSEWTCDKCGETSDVWMTGWPARWVMVSFSEGQCDQACFCPDCWADRGQWIMELIGGPMRMKDSKSQAPPPSQEVLERVYAKTREFIDRDIAEKRVAGLCKHWPPE